MKRITASLLTLLALALPILAHADWIDTPLRFRVSGVGPNGGSTGIWVRDTISTRLNGATTSGPPDTTADFDPMGIGTVGNTTALLGTTADRHDSLLVGWLLFSTDSTAGGISSIQVCFQGRTGGNENFSPVTLGNYQTIDSLSVTSATGAQARVIQVPITGSKLGWPIIRALITGGVGNSPSMTCVYRHWVAPGSTESRRN